MTTAKQIIIDGIDVSECGWYTQGATGMICADWHLSNDCSKNPNCHYKNWQRAEQKLAKIEEIAKQETETRMLFADTKSFNDFNKILQIIEGKENDR